MPTPGCVEAIDVTRDTNCLCAAGRTPKVADESSNALAALIIFAVFGEARRPSGTRQPVQQLVEYGVANPRSASDS
jgi:hypothetical protein